MSAISRTRSSDEDEYLAINADDRLVGSVLDMEEQSTVEACISILEANGYRIQQPYHRPEPSLSDPRLRLSSNEIDAIQRQQTWAREIVGKTLTGYRGVNQLEQSLLYLVGEAVTYSTADAKHYLRAIEETRKAHKAMLAVDQSLNSVKYR